MTPPTKSAALLAAWLSPGYPVGAFAWSHGLENAVAEGLVTDAATFR
ncbi:MAG: urease accessory protein, partial [Paracoccaceae bacterium]